MPLLQGQPFKLVKTIEDVPKNRETFIIQHTGEQFLDRGEYEDRLALYSQNIWTCQCTGRTGLTHQQAWGSEASVRVSAMSAIASPLHKPLLGLIHHSLAPLDQLVDAASMLCHSQFHAGEELMYLGSNPCLVKVLKVSECPTEKNISHESPEPIGNGVIEEDVVTGSSNGLGEGSHSTSPGKENDSNGTVFPKDEVSKREMLPRIYTAAKLEGQTIFENVLSKQLQRTYKVPSKDQIRLFIRSVAMRYRGATCTPWVVSDDLLVKHNIQNKLPAMFLCPKVAVNSSKRKSSMPPQEHKRPKLEKTLKVLKPVPPSSAVQPQSAPTHTLQILPKLNQALKKARPLKNEDKTPKRRGRPPLTKEEKERNKKIRQQTLLDLANKVGSPPPKSVKIAIAPSEMPSTLLQSPPPVLQSPSTYKSPIKRATTVEALMKLPLMRRLVHEYKTIKGVMGQYRRMAYTMDLALTKLSEAQIEMIPDENLRNDLYARQKKVQQKKFMENLSPEEKKEFMKKKARAIALERWKERKLKNLKIEDKTLKDLIPLPKPHAVKTPKNLPNYLFGDVVMVTEFLKCYRDLLFGEEKFKITTSHLMDAICGGLVGYQVIADIICGLLPTIILDDTSKDYKELGMPLSTIPINYQTAAELTRLCLKKYDGEDTTSNSSYDYDEVGKEQAELSDEILEKLEKYELWQLDPMEVLSILQALVHKTLVCSSLSVYMEEMDERASIAFREKRVILKKLQKEKTEETQKKRDEKKKSKEIQPKKARGRPKGYSPKYGGTLQEFYAKANQQNEPEKPMINAVLQRRKSAEVIRKEKALAEQIEKERLKQSEDEQKKRAAERKYDEIVAKRDDLLRKQPLGYDRHHNRYWIFHPTTPGLYMEKGWIDPRTNCQFILENSEKGHWSNPIQLPTTPVKKEISNENVIVNHSELNGTLKDIKSEDDGLMMNLSPHSDEDDKPLSVVKSIIDEEDNKPLSIVKTDIDEDDKPLIAVQSHLTEDDDKPLSSVKSKLTLSPMKMTSRGRPPKEAYVLVDEDTQTFPKVEVNSWFYYESMEDVKLLLDSLSDKGQRESQLMASLQLNKDRLQYHYNLKGDDMKLPEEGIDRIKISLKEDVVQIERELTEGWLGSIPFFDEWEENMQKADTVQEVGELLIVAQQHMQLKFLKGLMAPLKKQIVNENPEAPPEYEDIEGPGVLKWREAVRSSHTFSRLHVLVGLFDSSIKWERSMATRKCKICRSKQKDDPLLMCEKCENSYHMYCLRPPLKGDIIEPWLCPSCVPKKTRREEAQIVVEEIDPNEKDDPTFSIGAKPSRERACKKKQKAPPPEPSDKKIEQSCVVCLGRIGLITCSQCTTAYHSECHEPPLESRARKDWVCAPCKNPKAKSRRKDPVDGVRPEKPNVFGALDEITARPSSRSKKPVEVEEKRTGRIRRSAISDDYVTEQTEIPRNIRGAKARAIAKVEPSASRRSGRAVKRPRYKYESDKSSEEEDSDDEEEVTVRSTSRRATKKAAISDSDVSEDEKAEEPDEEVVEQSEDDGGEEETGVVDQSDEESNTQESDVDETQGSIVDEVSDENQLSDDSDMEDAMQIDETNERSDVSDDDNQSDEEC